jgi:hypothetical protein
MSDWLLHLPVVCMAIVIFAPTYLFAAVLYTCDYGTRGR